MTRCSKDRETLMTASNYWQLVRLDGTGGRRVEEVAIAKAFFQDRFPILAAQPAIADAPIQRELMQLLRTAANSIDRQRAAWCLRCFISHQIEQVCVQLEVKFGTQHGFTRYDLFPFVLNDHLVADQRFDQASNRQVSTQYRPLAVEILETFDSDRAGLSTWVTRQVRHHRELRAFLHEHGVLLATDWGILNDTNPESLRSILTEFYRLTPDEIAPAYRLLQIYHEVYRRDRLQQRQLGRLRDKEVCAAPSLDQLTRIAEALPAEMRVALQSPERILSQLQKIASQLRQYRLHRIGKTLPTQSLDRPGTKLLVAELSAVEPEIDLEEESFLTFYREQVMNCLDRSLAQVTSDRVTYLQRKKAEAAQQFLMALKLFHCKGQSMSEIAPQVGLQAQFQVTRLLKLKEFRANVRSRLLQLLFQVVVEKAKTYSDAARLQKLNQQIEIILEEQIDVLIQQTEKEGAVAKKHPLRSLFARRLCRHLDLRSNTP
ncbi:hypothetical protein IQ268_30900 [Oculatella sp. LEGE 06141]|nr:hypothetical protein [Oculatella sp. LEGE 06141]